MARIAGSEQLAATTAYNLITRVEQVSMRPGYNVSEEQHAGFTQYSECGFSSALRVIWSVTCLKITADRCCYFESEYLQQRADSKHRTISSLHLH